jgi:hypothetical protein
MKYLFPLAFLFIVSATSAAAQTNEVAGVGIGQWRMHTPYNSGIGVAEGGGRVYCAARYGLFSYSKSDGAIERLSRINGLSDFNVSVLRYNPQLNILVLTYDNSNIDLVYSDNSVYNIPDIYRKNIVGNKSINDITFVGQYAYLSCGFGIVQLDLIKREIRDTWYIGPGGTSISVNGLATDGTRFYAATNNGIYEALASDPNLFNYTAWSPDATLPYPGGKYGSITSFDGKIYTVNNDSTPNYDNILAYDGTTWSYFNNDHSRFTRVDAYKSHLILRNYYTAEAYNTSLVRTHFVSTSGYPNPQPNAALVDDQNIMWIADDNNGLVRHDPGPFTYEVILPNGPASIAVFDMQSRGRDMWVAGGSRTGTSADYTTNGAHWFSGNSWASYGMLNDPLYAGLTSSRDIVNLAVDPSDSRHAFMGTWGSGLLEYRPGGIVQVYDTTNSTLLPLNVPGFHPVQVGGLAFDSDNNLWVATNLNSKPLSVRSPGGTWQSFALPSPMNSSFLYNLLVDGYGQKWIVARGVGIGVWYENDPNNPNDNSFKFINSTLGNGNLPSLNVLSIAEDKDNTIWIGCDKGVSVIYSPYNVFGGGDFDAQKIIVEEGGYAQYLLESEAVTAIAVDGANRKWFGTLSSGAYLQSADGTQKILNFNTDNSPILSNTILSIAISEETGEVFFGTDKGIISYRGTATEGKDECDSPTAFPNPVRHDYRGPIAIRGLADNADVKITDISGNVVHQTKALGGQAVWDGNNYSGQRAHSGVYLIYASNADGSSTCVTKLLFIH